MSRIGLFGGSFNPIHNGHIAIAKAVLAQCQLDEIWLMVSPQNPLKQDQSLLDDALRLQLARKALADETAIKVCDYEFHLPKPSYTWTTLQHLKDDFPNHTFILLIGGDNWERFPRWYQSDEIIKDHQIMVYPRRNSQIDPQQLPAHVQMVETPLLDISSTEIREKVRQRVSIKGLVPESIRDQVEQYYLNFS